MVGKIRKTRSITIEPKEGAFTALFKRFRTEKGKEKSDIALLRSALSNEKARLMHVLKIKQPNSIYETAKLLGRNFKAVRQDIALLEKLGFVEMIPVHKGKRQKLKPILVIDSLEIKINI